MRYFLIFAIALLLLIVGFIFWNTLTPNSIPTGKNKNINYGTSSGPEKVAEYRRDCAERGGKLNECGSICDDPEGPCAAVCAFICEFE